MAHTLPALAYAFDALEPHIDAQTMQIQHDKHHQAYVDNLNKALAGTDSEGKTLEELMDNIFCLPSCGSNNGGRPHNPPLILTGLSPNGGKPTGDLATAINEAF